MKTVTMDWETYQDEIKASKEAIEEAFDNGAKENQRRLDPIIDYCLLLIKREPDLHDSLISLLTEAGEL